MFRIEKIIVPSFLYEGTRRRPYWIFSRGLLLGVAVVGFYSLHPYLLQTIPNTAPFELTRNRLTATAIFSNVILTFALIAVYRDMTTVQQSQVDEMADQGELQSEVVNIQKDQADILKRQGEIMGARHKPIIQISDYTVVEDTVFLELSNIGNGLAHRLGLEVYIELSEEEGDVTETEGRKYEVTPQPMERSSIAVNHSYRSVLRPGEMNTAFEMVVGLPDVFDFEDPQEVAHSYINFEHWWKEASSYDYQYILVHFVLTYEDVTEQEHRIPFWPIRKLFAQFDTLEELLALEGGSMSINPRYFEEDSISKYGPPIGHSENIETDIK